MARTRIMHRGYAIEVWQVDFTYAAAIEPVRPELSVLGRRIMDGFETEDRAVKFSKGRIDAMLEG